MYTSSNFTIPGVQPLGTIVEPEDAYAAAAAASARHFPGSNSFPETPDQARARQEAMRAPMPAARTVRAPATDYMYIAQKNGAYALAGAAVSYLSAGERSPNIRELGAGALAGMGVLNLAMIVIGPPDDVTKIVPAVAGTALAAYISGLIG